MLTLLVTLLACGGPSSPPSATPKSGTPARAASTKTPAIAPAEVWKGAETLVLGDGSACTIVAIHGFGATPASMKGLYAGMDLNAVVVLPRGPEPRGDGYAWFMRTSEASSNAEFAKAIGDAADRLAVGIEAGVPGAKHEGAPIVTGFSQGGMLTWGLTARHPKLVDTALPVSGLLPRNLLPEFGGPTPIHVFHGDNDDVVSHAADRSSASKMTALGWKVHFNSYPGVGHSITPEMRVDLGKELTAACR